jgi:type IV pilus assembly protein PilY1
VAARRGGNFIYAIDVSDPDNPTFKFKLSPSTSGLSTLGQTWSMPKVTKVRDGTASGRVVLIFGGGYDTAEDSDTAGTTGRGVYVVDALWDGDQAIPHFGGQGEHDFGQHPGCHDRQRRQGRPGFVDRAYVGDLAGNIWRMDLMTRPSTIPPAGWKLHNLASLGARKFFFRQMLC